MTEPADTPDVDEREVGHDPDDTPTVEELLELGDTPAGDEDAAP